MTFLVDRLKLSIFYSRIKLKIFNLNFVIKITVSKSAWKDGNDERECIKKDCIISELSEVFDDEIKSNYLLIPYQDCQPRAYFLNKQR